MLTQSEGELIEPLQLGHKGTDRVPGLLLKSEVTWVLDGLQARNTGRGTDVTYQKMSQKAAHLFLPLLLKAIVHFS